MGEEYDYRFFENNPPDQIKLNNQNINNQKGGDYLEIELNKDGLNTIDIIWNSQLTKIRYMQLY